MVKLRYSKWQAILIGIIIALLITTIISQLSEIGFIEIFIYAFFIAAGGNLGYYFFNKLWYKNLPDDLKKIQENKKKLRYGKK